MLALFLFSSYLNIFHYFAIYFTNVTIYKTANEYATNI